MPPSAAPIICNKTICLRVQTALQWRMAPRFLTILTGRNLPKIILEWGVQTWAQRASLSPCKGYNDCKDDNEPTQSDHVR